MNRVFATTPARPRKAPRRIGGILVAVAGLNLLAACGEPTNVGYPYKDDRGQPVYARSYEEFEAKRQTIWGKGGLDLFGSKKSGQGEEGGGGGGIGVNSYLWRASLETISFMPVNSADPFGGVIITDWHTAAEVPNERFKLNVYIMGRTLRADGIKVAVFRQMKDPMNGTWIDANTPDQTSTRIEDAILAKARQMRNSVAEK